jgi:hypothetical protein
MIICMVRCRLGLEVGLLVRYSRVRVRFGLLLGIWFGYG